MRMRVREVFDITLTSAFAEYNVDLWDRYGLIFIDAGYYHEASSMILPEEHVLYCMQRNFNGNDSVLLGKDLLKLDCINVETEGVRFATDFGGRAVLNQAVRYMKYHYKLAYIEELYKNAKDYEEKNYSEEDLKAKQDEALEALGSKDVPVLNELKESAMSAVVDEKTAGLLSTLRLVIPTLADVSGVSISVERLVSRRTLNAGNDGAFDEEYSFTDALLFKEYLLTKCGNYLAQDDRSVLKYEVEYLISGRSSDIENLEGVVNRILLMREAANLAALYADEKKQKLVSGIATVLAIVAGGPEVEPAIQALINCVWAYIESVSDVKKLMSGKKVPLIKDSGDWESCLEILGLEGNSVNEDEGLSYSDYLRILLYLSRTESLIKRFMDVCELNMQKAEGAAFRLDYCFDYWKICATVISGYGYEYSIVGKKDLEE